MEQPASVTLLEMEKDVLARENYELRKENQRLAAKSFEMEEQLKSAKAALKENETLRAIIDCQKKQVPIPMNFTRLRSPWDALYRVRFQGRFLIS